MTDPSHLAADLEDLQIRLSFQEDTLQQLDAVIIRQNAVIERLQRRCDLLEDRLRALESRPAEGQKISPEKPPHY